MKYIFSIFCLITLGCSYENSKEDIYHKNERDVINDLFLQLVISDIAYLRGIEELGPPPLPSLYKSDSKEYIIWKRAFEKLNSNLTKENLDTVSSTVYLPDSLFQIRNKLISSSHQVFSKLYGRDSLFRLLVLKLQDSLKSVKFDFKSLANRGKLKILPYHLYSNSSLKVKARYSFSRIAFDNGFQNGCFSFSINCGSLCGGENLYFIKKINGKWSIVQEESLGSY